MARNGSRAKPKKPTWRIPGGFTLGGEAAETDPLLERAFFETGDYEVLASRHDRHCFIIGRTGGGKSAILHHLQDVRGDHVIRLDPENLALTYISDLGVMKYLRALEVHLDPFLNALWKHVLVVEVLKHHYNVDSPEVKQNVMAALREKIKRDRSKQAALQYLEEFESKFWEETDQRVREITRRFEDQVGAEAKAHFGIEKLAEVGGHAGAGSSASHEERVEQADRFQRIVNESQVPRLNQMIRVLREDILDSEQDFVYVLVDDLDRDWVDEQVENDLIRCLFRAVFDLQKVRNLKVLVALRTNIFEHLDFGRTGGQEEKYRSLVLRMRWTKTDLIAMLDERVRTAVAEASPETEREPAGIGPASIAALLPRTNPSRGNPIDYIFARTLMRPRDVIAFLNHALARSKGKPGIAWDAIKEAERPYSQGRLDALRDEWKLNYPGIDEVLKTLRGADERMDREAFQRYLDEMALLPSEPSFQGKVWLTEITQPIWNASPDDDWADQYHRLIRLLYRIGFIGFSSSTGGPITYAHEDLEFSNLRSSLTPDSLFSVHRTFHAALDIRASRT